MNAVLAMTVVLSIYDSAGSLVPGMLTVTLYILEALPSFCVLGMPFLYACNPVINRARHNITFNSLVVLHLLQQPAATVELFPLDALCKDMGDE